MIELDERLSMLYKMTPRCAMAADIGADHGFLGAHLLETGRCERVELLDISEDSLQKARRLIRREGLAERALFTVGDGVAALQNDAQAVVIAGMGAPTITGIIERGLNRLEHTRLILQPNMGVDLLRRELVRMGFVICDEAVVQAAGRWYVAMAAEKGQASYTDMELLAGPVLLRRRDDALRGYAAFRLRVQRKAYEGALKGHAPHAGELAREIRLWEEIVQCL